MQQYKQSIQVLAGAQTPSAVGTVCATTVLTGVPPNMLLGPVEWQHCNWRPQGLHM